MNVNSLEGKEGMIAFHETQQSWCFAVNWTKLPSCYAGLKNRCVKEINTRLGGVCCLLAVLRWISLTDHTVKPKIWPHSLRRITRRELNNYKCFNRDIML